MDMGTGAAASRPRISLKTMAVPGSYSERKMLFEALLQLSSMI